MARPEITELGSFGTAKPIELSTRLAHSKSSLIITSRVGVAGYVGRCDRCGAEGWTTDELPDRDAVRRAFELHLAELSTPRSEWSA